MSITARLATCSLQEPRSRGGPTKGRLPSGSQKGTPALQAARHDGPLQASRQLHQQRANAATIYPGRSRSSDSSAAVEPAPRSDPSLPPAALALPIVAAAVAAVPVLLPQAAGASAPLLATLMPSLAPQHMSDTLYWGCVGMGAASLLTTLVCTARFIISFFPGLEREAEQRRWQLPWVAVTLYDPLLQPVRKRVFGQNQEGDLDYAAVALLAIICSLLETLVGKDGMLNDSIPDFALLHALQWLIFFMHGQLLPAWVLVVLRWGRQI